MTAETILIADNNPSNVQLIKLALDGHGYDIRTASNSVKTIKILKEFQPKLILMEIELPGIDGLELTRRLKDDPKYHNITIVAVTACGMKGDKEMAMSAGFDGYISKPIDFDTFDQTVADYLNNKNGVIATEK